MAASFVAVPLRAQEVEIPNGGTIPEFRPCVDHVGRGALRTTGERNDISDPDDLIGHSLYHYRFDEQSTILGARAFRRQDLVIAGHALRAVRVPDAIVVTAQKRARTRFISWEWVWTDLRGRPFIPVLGWPDPYDWRPQQAFRRAVRPVRYKGSQPFWRDVPLDDMGDEALFVTRGGRTEVRYGLYLSDIPAMFEQARTERCWR